MEEMREAVATHAARAYEKLRSEGLAARAVQVFFNTGHAESKGPHRLVALAADLPRVTNITPEVLRLTSRPSRRPGRTAMGGKHTATRNGRGDARPHAGRPRA